MASAAPDEALPEHPVEACAEVLYGMMSKRASSWDALDIAVEVNDGHVDAEVMFAGPPDIGVSIDVAYGEAHVCVLDGSERERWHPVPVTGLQLSSRSREELTAQLEPVVRHMLDVRRENATASEA